MKNHKKTAFRVLILYLLSVLTMSASYAQDRGLNLYRDYYQQNNGEVEVYYDGIDEDGRLVGGKVTLPLEPVEQVSSRSVTPPPTWAYETIFENGPSDNRIDIVIVGDGYTTTELGNYATHTDNILAGYFAEEPFTSYINFFNVHRVDVISNESGVDEPDLGIYKDTALDMNYNCGGTPRLLCVNVSKAWDAASVAPEADQILALANSTRYGGAGYSDLATMAGNNSESVDLALHEFGHSFGKLADEYHYGDGTTYTGSEPAEINVSIYQTSQMEDIQTKWYLWLDLANVGTFEGAMYKEYGIYRPTSDSLMRSLGRPFEEVNTEQLIFKVYEAVSIIDDATPQFSVPVSCYTEFYVVPLEPLPNTLDIQWYFDAQPVLGATGTLFTPDVSSLSSGVYDVSVTVVDNTTRVRNEVKRAQLMSETLQWQINVDKRPDLNRNYKVDFDDFPLLAIKWGDTDCLPDNSFCDGADIDRSGQVDLLDLSQLCSEWLIDYLLPQTHWRLDDGSGTSANDDTGNGYTGTLVGNPVWVAGYDGGALQFDGLDDYMEISGYKGITGTAGRTCSAWIKTTQTTTGEFISWGSVDIGAKWAVGIRDNVFSVRVSGGKILGSTEINDDKWHHVAVTWEPDGDNMLSHARLYVDGLEETISSLLDIEINTAASEDVHIGNFQTLNHFQGLIDDVRIHNKTLNQLEIIHMIYDPHVTPISSWPFDADASDEVSGHDGILVSGAAINTADPAVGTGAVELDGVDDYVEISEYKGITGTAGRTCSAWIKTTQTTTGEFISWGSVDIGAKWAVGIRDNVFSVRVSGGKILGSTEINDDKWHHVAVTWEPDGDNMLSHARLYVDGLEETISSLLDIEINTAASEDVHIGNFQTLNHFQGLIDDVRIYDKALGQLEIQMITTLYY